MGFRIDGGLSFARVCLRVGDGIFDRGWKSANAHALSIVLGREIFASIASPHFVADALDLRIGGSVYRRDCDGLSFQSRMLDLFLQDTFTYR